MKLTGFTDAAFKALVDEPTGLALRGLAIVLQSDDKDDRPMAADGKGNLIDFVCRKQRRVVRSTFSAELNGLIDSIEQLLLCQANLHEIYCGTTHSPQQLVDLMEHGCMYPPIDVCVDARAVFDALAASDVCDPQESSLKLHLISVRDRLAAGILRFLFWVDTRDMFADGMTKGALDRAALNAVMLGTWTLQHKHETHHERTKTDDHDATAATQPPTTRLDQ